MTVINKPNINKDSSIENIRIKDKDDLEERYVELVNKYNELLNYIMDTLKENNKNISEMVSSNKDMLDTLNDASRSVIYTRATKNKGTKNPNYKSEINTDELIKEYIDNGYKLTSDMVSKYNITYQGIRLRLVERGIWKANRH